MIEREFERLSKGRCGEVEFDRTRVEQALKKIAIDVGPYSDYVLPEKALGRDVMIPFRFKGDDVRPNEEIVEILVDQVIDRQNSRNQLPLGVNEPALFPNPNFRPLVRDIDNSITHVLWARGFTNHAEAYLYQRFLEGLLKTGELKQKHKPYDGYPSQEFKEDIIKKAKKRKCYTVDQLNDLLKQGKPFIDLIETYHADYKKEIIKAVREMSQMPKLKVMAITGKSSSGKTTTTEMICDQMKKKFGIRFVPLKVDNYFLNRCPEDARGDVYYELPESLDLIRLSRDLSGLLTGAEVMIPTYDMQKGRRLSSKYDQKMKLGDEDVLVIDSHQALFREIRNCFKPRETYMVYLEPWNIIEDKEGKTIPRHRFNMMRRWLRDRHKRKTPYDFNIPHWKTARLGELRDIVPRMLLANTHINTGFPFELNYLAAMYNKENDFHKPEFFLKQGKLYGAIMCYHAHRILEMAKPAPQKYMTKKVLPDDSILREFIGGSKYGAI